MTVPDDFICLHWRLPYNDVFCRLANGGRHRYDEYASKDKLYSTTQKLSWKTELAGIHYLPCIAGHNISPSRGRPLPSIPKY